MLHRSCAVATIILIAACSDRTVTPPADSPMVASAVNAKRPEALAKMFAKGLKNPAFRAYLKAQLNASPYREHKLEFKTFLAANDSRAMREIAVENGATKDALADEAKAAIALEVYFPVPAHRAAWTGDEQVLVATAVTDDDPPIAFDGRNGLRPAPRARHRMHRQLRWDHRGRHPTAPARARFVHDQKPFRTRL